MYEVDLTGSLILYHQLEVMRQRTVSLVKSLIRFQIDLFRYQGPFHFLRELQRRASRHIKKVAQAAILIP